MSLITCIIQMKWYTESNTNQFQLIMGPNKGWDVEQFKFHNVQKTFFFPEELCLVYFLITVINLRYGISQNNILKQLVSA